MPAFTQPSCCGAAIARFDHTFRRPCAGTNRQVHLRQARCGKKWRSRPISRVLSWTVIPLGASSPIRSSNLPGPDAGSAMRSLFGLAPGGVCRAGLLPDSRCALTAPFHPCHAPGILSNTRPFGGLLSVALSVGSRRPGVTWHRALWSPDFPRHRGGRTRCDDATVWPTPPRAVYRLPEDRGGLSCPRLVLEFSKTVDRQAAQLVSALCARWRSALSGANTRSMRLPMQFHGQRLPGIPISRSTIFAW